MLVLVIIGVGLMAAAVAWRFSGSSQPRLPGATLSMIRGEVDMLLLDNPTMSVQEALDAAVTKVDTERIPEVFYFNPVRSEWQAPIGEPVEAILLASSDASDKGGDAWAVITSSRKIKLVQSAKAQDIIQKLEQYHVLGDPQTGG